ncbi:hypothetical protein ACKF11_13140 [Methylobacillus sp. Pita2]|uniref:hypothetical protein n=1 Tax=Methylobacillus sp. Pita2 TaxID=3383245 RepID=UPI0038B58FE1
MTTKRQIKISESLAQELLLDAAKAQKHETINKLLQSGAPVDFLTPLKVPFIAHVGEESPYLLNQCFQPMLDAGANVNFGDGGTALAIALLNTYSKIQDNYANAMVRAAVDSGLTFETRNVPKVGSRKTEPLSPLFHFASVVMVSITKMTTTEQIGEALMDWMDTLPRETVYTMWTERAHSNDRYNTNVLEQIIQAKDGVIGKQLSDLGFAILVRAASMGIPIDQPLVRLHWLKPEESSLIQVVEARTGGLNRIASRTAALIAAAQNTPSAAPPRKPRI